MIDLEGSWGIYLLAMLAAYFVGIATGMMARWQWRLSGWGADWFFGRVRPFGPTRRRWDGLPT